jgi:hypothetical protein
MSPFSGAASLVEEAIGTSQSPIDIRTERVTFVAPAGGGELRVGAAEAARSPRIRASPPPQVAPRSPNAIRATPG